jgi:hypothetical protein
MGEFGENVKFSFYLFLEEIEFITLFIKDSFFDGYYLVVY